MITKNARARIGPIGLPSLVLFVWVIFCVAAWWVVSPRPGVTLENANRIRYGMTLDEVDGLFGEPGKQETGGGFLVTDVRSWKADGLTVLITFTYGSRFDEGESGVSTIHYNDERDEPLWWGLSTRRHPRLPAIFSACAIG
jgi:hypothetical protein